MLFCEKFSIQNIHRRRLPAQQGKKTHLADICKRLRWISCDLDTDRRRKSLARTRICTAASSGTPRRLFAGANTERRRKKGKKLLVCTRQHRFIGANYVKCVSSCDEKGKYYSSFCAESCSKHKAHCRSLWFFPTRKHEKVERKFRWNWDFNPRK